MWKQDKCLKLNATTHPPTQNIVQKINNFNVTQSTREDKECEIASTYPIKNSAVCLTQWEDERSCKYKCSGKNHSLFSLFLITFKKNQGYN